MTIIIKLEIIILIAGLITLLSFDLAERIGKFIK